MLLLLSIRLLLRHLRSQSQPRKPQKKIKKKKSQKMKRKMIKKHQKLHSRGIFRLGKNWLKQVLNNSQWNWFLDKMVSTICFYPTSTTWCSQSSTISQKLQILTVLENLLKEEISTWLKWQFLLLNKKKQLFYNSMI